MKPAANYFCEVCGKQQKDGDWFLLTEDPGHDTVQILKWNRRLAENPGMRCLCSAEHVESLVSHWMLSGSLDYGWSRPGCMPHPPAAACEDVDGSYRLGELMLDRASFAALGERPDMLNSILEAIDGALQAVDGTRSLLEEQEEEDLAPTYDA